MCQPCNATDSPTAVHTIPVRWLTGRAGLAVACLLAAGFAVAAFLPAINNEFVYDDYPLVVQNPAVRQDLPRSAEIPWYRIWLEPYWPIETSPDKLYRPLTTWTLRVNGLFAGDPLEARPFRVVNMGLHVLASIGVVMLGWRLTGSAAASALAGVLFASHPVHTEAIVPIYGRSELLAGCLGAWLLVRHVGPWSRVTSGLPTSANRRATGGLSASEVSRLVINPLLLLAAIMSKEHAVFLWPAMMAIDVWRRRDPALPASRVPRREWFNRFFAPVHIGYALAVAVFLFFRFLVFGWKTHLEASRTRIYDVPMAHVGLVEHVLTPFRLLWLVVRNLFQTESLCPIWSYPALSPAARLESDVVAGMIVAVAMVVLIVILWYRRALSGALLVGLLLTLAIPIQAIPVARWFYAERWLYLPTVLIAVLLAGALRRWGRAPALGVMAAGLLLLPQSWQYATKFADNLTMQHEVIIRQPDNYHGRRNYASILYLEGYYPEAIQAANQMIERFGDVSDAYKVLFLSYLELGDGRRALQAIDKYENLRLHLPEPSLTEQRKRAEALLDEKLR